jgi:hypothetical protein
MRSNSGKRKAGGLWKRTHPVHSRMSQTIMGISKKNWEGVVLLNGKGPQDSFEKGALSKMV